MMETTDTIRDYLDYLRQEALREKISWSEIADLQALRDHIAADDVVLLQWAGVPEFHTDECVNAGLFGETACRECRSRARS